MAARVTGLQYPMVFVVPVDHEAIGDELSVEVPPGFVLLNVSLAKREAFDGTTPEVSVTDNKTVPTVLIAPADLSDVATPNVTAELAVRFTEYRSGGKIRILPVSGIGAPTTGYADVIIEGVVRGRQNERFGPQYDA